MKKIGIFIRSMNEGGAEKQSIYLTKALSKKRNAKLIVLFREGKLLDRLGKVLNQDQILFIKGSNYLSKAFYLFKCLKKEKFVTLICYLPSNNIMGTIIGKLAGVKYIFGGLRGTKIKENWLKMIIQKYLLNYFSIAIISNSYKGTEAYVNYGLKRKKIHVIHNSIEIQNSFIYREKKPKINILSVGRFVEEKDYKTALLSIKNLISTVDIDIKINYIIVGYGEKKEQIFTLLKEYGLGNIVQVVVRPPDVNFYYKKADIFLLTSKNEGMPNVIMEAMSFSLPIVTTKVGDISYLVIDGKNGYTTEIGDYKKISSKLRNLISSHTLRINFGRQSLHILKKDFTLKKFRETYETLINQYENY